jgi:hypothetical protein
MVSIGKLVYGTLQELASLRDEVLVWVKACRINDIDI